MFCASTRGEQRHEVDASRSKNSWRRIFAQTRLIRPPVGGADLLAGFIVRNSPPTRWSPRFATNHLIADRRRTRRRDPGEEDFVFETADRP